MSDDQSYKPKKTSPELALNQVLKIDTTELRELRQDYFVVSKYNLNKIKAIPDLEPGIIRWVNQCLVSPKTLTDALVDFALSNVDLWNDFFTNPKSNHLIYRCLLTRYGGTVAKHALYESRRQNAKEEGKDLPPPPQFESDEEGESDV